VGVHRSRYELERVLGRYGASDFAFVEGDANASIQFALQGRYVQLALPLPDPNAAHFTHTASGRARTVTAQERAYEQALREHWRALLLAVRGKLQSVESGISTFEDEFAGFLVPHFHEQKTARRKRPRAVNWLLGSSHSVAIALVAAFLVPASAVGAFSLPPSVVDHLAAPFRGALPDELAVPSEHARAVALGQGNWILDETGSHGNRTSLAAERDFAASAPEGDDPQPRASGAAGDVQPAELGGLRQGAQATSQGTRPVPSGGQASDGDKEGGQSSDAPGGSGAGAGQGAGNPSGDYDAPASDGGDAAAPPDDGAAADGQTSGADEESQPGAGDPGPPSDGSDTPESGSGATPADPGTDTESQPDGPGDGHDNGNHHGDDNGNHNGDDNGNHNGDENGNHNGADNGQNGGGAQGGS
jgi:hypothetical protein